MGNGLRSTVLAVMSALIAGPATADTLDRVKASGAVACGVNVGLPGFAWQENDRWRGLDVDFCRAVAAAIFNDPDAVRWVPLSAGERFEALRSGEIDILSRNTTWTMTRDAGLGFHFAGVTYYDGQGFMVRAELGVVSADELGGMSVCVQADTTTELNLEDFFRAGDMDYEPVLFEDVGESVAAYGAGDCQALTADASALYALRQRLADPEAHVVLSEVISKEPLGPVVRQGDDTWFNLVKWVHNAMLYAEELGVTQHNVARMRRSRNREIRRLLGAEGDFGAMIGLELDWAYRIIRHIGNYGESFERNVGRGSSLRISRGLNALWIHGGLHYPMPIR